MTLGVLALGELAVAEPAKAPAKVPASVTPVPTPPLVHTSGILHIANEIARGLGQIPPGSLVVVSPLASDIAAPKGDELAVRVATQIAGRIAGHAHLQPATLGVARGMSGRAASLVHVQLELTKGELRAAADLYPVIANGWERLRNPAPGPRAHAFAGASIDAEVRTFLQPIVLEQAGVHKARHEEVDVLAIGCGDVDADGGNELVVVTRTRIVLGKLRGGKLAVLQARPWTQLASRVPVPMREPTASVVVSRAHRDQIFVGMTDRGAVAVDATLLTRRQLAGMPIPGSDGAACASVTPELGAFEGAGMECAPLAKATPNAILPTPAARFDAIAALDLVAKDGSVTQIVAAREPTGTLRLRRSDASGKSSETPIEHVGAQVALADLDLDGSPEMAFSGELMDSDTISVWSWQPNGLVQRLRFPTKEAVHAIAACPPEERGLPALVAVVGSEVWLVR